MKSGMHSDIAPWGFPKTAQWLQSVTWILGNTKTLHAWNDCQLNSIPQNKHFSQVFHCTSSKLAVTYAAHSGHQRSPSGTGTAHPRTSRHSCSWCCTAVLQRDTQNQPKTPQWNWKPFTVFKMGSELWALYHLPYILYVYQHHGDVFSSFPLLLCSNSELLITLETVHS